MTETMASTILSKIATSLSSLQHVPITIIGGTVDQHTELLAELREEAGETYMKLRIARKMAQILRWIRGNCCCCCCC